MAIIDLGFTGTQDGMTTKQLRQVEERIRVIMPKRFHHGLCIGADTEAHHIVRKIGKIKIVGHPPIDQSKMTDLDCDEMWDAAEYRVRNYDIVNESQHLLATPKSRREQFRGSGTWMTIRYARRSGKPREIIWP